MTRLTHVIAWTSAAALVASGALYVPMLAQAPTSSTKIAEQAKRATPRLGGHVDLNGTWDHVDGIAFLRPQQIDGGSLCLLGCAQATPSSTGTATGGQDWCGPAGTSGARLPEGQARLRREGRGPDQTPGRARYRASMPAARRAPYRTAQEDSVQNAREVVFLNHDVSGAFFRIIPIDGRSRISHPFSSSYLGDAIGRWEGDTLVVETTNFNEETWLTDGRVPHGQSQGDRTAAPRGRHDRGIRPSRTIREVLAEPWALRPQTIWLSDQELEEPIHCQDRDLAHVVDGTHHDNPR